MISRPKTLAQVAERSESLADFGRTLRDWLHELRRASSRPEVIAAIAAAPRILRGRFPDGAVADAWLGAYAEYVAGRARTTSPLWAHKRDRVAPEPWFADPSPNSTIRIDAMRLSPLPFKRRNLYTRAVELPLELRAGRPAKPADEKRRANAERQRRFRIRRKEELAALRAQN